MRNGRFGRIRGRALAVVLALLTLQLGSLVAPAAPDVPRNPFAVRSDKVTDDMAEAAVPGRMPWWPVSCL